ANGFEPDAAAEVRFQELAVLDSTHKFQSQGFDLAIRPTAADTQNPRQAQIHQDVGLHFFGLQIKEFYRGLLTMVLYSDFLRAGQLFIASNALQSIAQGPAANRGNRGGLVALESWLCAQLQPNRGISAGLSDS